MKYLLLLLTAYFSQAAFSQDFSERMAAGNAKNLTEVESKYTLKISSFIRSSASLKKCFALTNNGDRLEMRVVADIVVADELKEQGFLQNIAVRPDSPATQCLSQSLSRLSLPLPPKSPLPFSMVLLLINDY